ncbi:3771_t:CDS:2, partial [Dentiscutata heterogama]
VIEDGSSCIVNNRQMNYSSMLNRIIPILFLRMNGLFVIFIICILIIRLDASFAPGHLHIRQANNTNSPAPTAVGHACPTTPVVFTTTVNSSTSTTFTSVSTVTGSTTSFVTFTGAQAIPSATTATLPAIDFNSKLIPRNETIPYEAFK